MKLPNSVNVNGHKYSIVQQESTEWDGLCEPSSYTIYISPNQDERGLRDTLLEANPIIKKFIFR